MAYRRLSLCESSATFAERKATLVSLSPNGTGLCQPRILANQTARTKSFNAQPEQTAGRRLDDRWRSDVASVATAVCAGAG